MLSLKEKIQQQKGQILVLSVILLPLLLIMSIFVIEAGLVYIKQTQLQNAADAIALAGIDNKNDAEKIVKLNRTIDFTKVIIPDNYPNNSSVVLQEDVVPIFDKIFGTDVITTITVSSKAEDGKLVPLDF